MVKYNITKEAVEDLYNIWNYTVDTWSEEQADKYYDGLNTAISKIASAPLLNGKPFDEILPGLRAFHFRRHMVFYFIQQDGRVLIARVLHERMDYSLHFNM